MADLDIDVPTPDGTAGAYLRMPKGEGPWPGVILYPDIGSLRATFAEMADHLAGLGYVVLVPDIYYRSAPWAPFDITTVFSDKEEMGRAFGLAASIGPDEWASDAIAFADYLGARAEVADGPLGTTGYCFGGRISLTVAGRLGDRVGAAASIHGGGLASVDDERSPHLLASHVRAEVYVGAARDDGSFTPEQASVLADAYDAAGVTATIEDYDALHGFAVPDNPTFDPAASARHWDALDELYRRALG